jgi:PKD repeat protein/glucose/arabinose dehydrogenase/type 1 glutamine amidotransferase
MNPEENGINMSRAGAVVHSVMVALLVVIGLVAAPAAHAQDFSPPTASPLDQIAAAEETGHVLIFSETAAFRHTDAITNGTPKIVAALQAAGITSEVSEDSAIFNPTDLARFDAIVMFQTSGDPWTGPGEKEALQAFQRSGNGIAAIHNATDMRGNFQWWDNLVGSLMPGHADTSPPLGLQADVIVEDRSHPSTKHLDGRWTRRDEWYNYSTNVRGNAHVLLAMDETTYEPGGNRMGYDHPISWCKPYDGGRVWVTGMGHFGAHYDEPDFLANIVGGVKYAAGLEAGDCGGTVNSNFEKVALDDNTSAPFALDIAPDGRVFFTELVRGEIRVYNPTTGTVKTAVDLDVYWGGEDGLLGIAVDPQFATNNFIYVYWSPNKPNNADPSSFFSRVSRFTVGADSTIDPASEKLIIEVPARREPDEPGHTGGGLDFDLQGNLLLGVGDDVNPHSEPSGGYAPLSERDGTFHDARATSANTNDLRGKLLRITPSRDGDPGYTIPSGNMFDEAQDAQDKTRPEIYAMGFRNPFRFSVDPNTGWIGLADYAPDSGTNAPDTRGPAGIVEWNLIKEPGNYGWPLCIGPNNGQVAGGPAGLTGRYRDVDYRTNPVTVGEFFDCANPVNDSIRNTGLTNLPPSKAPVMYYGYSASTVPAVIPAGGGLAPMGGPFYDFDPNLQSDTKFPEYFDGKPFFYEWSKNRIYSMLLDDAGTKLEKISRFLPTESFLSPQDMKFGPDGALYTLEWGGGFGRDNPNSGIYRVDYINGSRSPVAKATATPDTGQEPLVVAFSSDGSVDPEGGTLSYAWDFQNDGVVDSTMANPTFTYTAPGSYTARLTVQDPAGKTGTTVVPVTVGNTRPSVKFNGPVNGGFLDWGDQLNWEVEVTDPEDGAIDYQDVTVVPSLGHDNHDHATTIQRGKTGSVITDLGSGHAEDMKVFFTLDARYTDKGGEGAPALTGRSLAVLQPKHKEAEHADLSAGTETGAVSGDLEGGGNDGLLGLNAGDWAAYRPVNLTGIDSLTFRVASTQAGGGIELRKDSPTGELLGSAAVPNTGGPQRWSDVTIDTPESTATMSLYVVFTGTANFRMNFWEVNGKGLSATTRPQVQITSPTDLQAVDPGTSTLTATATDAENEVTSVEFFIDGQSVGTDNTAPYSVDWTETEEDYYVVHAVATNDAGLTKASRKVRFSVGEFGVRPPWATFGNTTPAATFDKLGDNFKISAAGSDLWQATNQYGAVYLPGGTPENFEAVVKVASFDGTHSNSKAGIMVRNKIPQDETDRLGYMVFSEKGNGEAEFMHDAGGNGQVNDDGEPVATGCGTSEQPSWLKVQKKNKVFTVWCSRNGVDWTQVGAPTLIPAAAAVQDIGLFVVSHIAGTLATAEFSDWELTEIDGGTDPGPEEPAPSCAQLKSDEFDGTALDAARWTTIRGTPTVGGGNVTLPITNGDIDGANQGAISYLGQPAPAGAWTATTKVTLEQDNEWQYAGLLLHVDDDNYTKLAFTKHENDSRFLEFWSETGGSRTGHGANIQVPTTFGTTVYVRLISDGTQLTAHYSADGTAWTQVGSAAPLKTAAKIGPVAAGDVDAENKTAAFDWFRFTPDEPPADPGFDDEFAGDELDGCRWDKIRGWKSSNLEVADGKLAITTFDADISGTNNGPVQNLILQTPPAGDWTVETKMTAPLKDSWQLAGFMLHADDDHYVKYDIVADNAPGETPVRRVELRYENGGNLTGPGAGPDLPPPASATDTWWLRLTKTGNTYTGQISVDGVTWQQTPGSVTVPLSNPGLGLMAMGPSQSDGPIDVTFDYIKLVEEPANAAPEITSATATPDSGEAPLPVQFAATATDADDDELTYSWDFDGDGTEDADDAQAAHTYTEPGVYQAKVTVSDGEATDSATVEVTVEDGGGPGQPTVQAFADPSSGAAPLAVNLSATGLDPDGGALTYRWAFSDGGTALGANLTRTYTTPGTYTATVTVTDDEGDTASKEVTITVTPPNNEAPVIIEATADRPSGPAPHEVWFQAVAEDPEGKPLTYKWEFGDGTGSALGEEAEHIYRTPGTYTAKLTVTDQGGKSDTEEIAITVTNPPGNEAPSVEAAVAPASGLAPLNVLLTAQASDPDDDALTYVWDFGDGSDPGRGRRARHTYTRPGTFTAKVTVTDRAGLTASATVEIVVGNPPANQAPTVLAAADPAGGTAPLAITFTASGSDPDGDDLSYVWSFGDGGAAGGTKVTHTFAQAGTYTVTVTVKDATGNTGSATLTVVVAAPQQAAGGSPAVAPKGAATSAIGVTTPSIGAFGKRGVKVTVACPSGGKGTAKLRVSKRAARRLGVGRRALATRAVTCVEGETLAFRVKPSAKVARAIRASRPKSLSLTLRLALPGGDPVQRKLTLHR